MRRLLPPILSALAVTGLGPATPATAQQDEQPTRREGTLVTGRVLDRAGGDPIPGARVVLVGTGQEQGTDGQGGFAFLRVPPGRYWLHVERLGYGAVDDTVAVPGRGRLELDIRLAREPFELDPVVAAVERLGGPGIRGFYERKRTLPGRYLTRADLEEPGVVDLADALRRVPGIRMAPRVSSGFSVGHAIRLRDGCAPTVYVDGVRLAGGANPDEFLVPDEVEGIEIYSGAQTPASFSSSGGCGAVVIWTRSGGGRGTIPFWRGLLYAGVFVAAAALLVVAF